MEPEDALAAARAAAEAARAEGRYADALEGLTIAPTGRVDTGTLMEWAVVEPDVELMRSTRRLGAPITLAKRTLLHVLRQYHAELLSQQVRFNMHLLGRVAELEDRIAKLEGERR